jgi:hypothetical protein
MAQTLSFGYIKNQTGDKGSVFWPDLEFNIQRVNDHTHNGVNSAKLGNASIDPSTQQVLPAAWVAVVDQTGTWKQTVTVPAGVDLNKHYPRFKDVASGNLVFLTVKILTDATYEVEINDNTIELQVAYV